MRDRLAEQRVARQVQDVALEPGGVELLGHERRRDAAIGRHRAVSVRVDERDDDARRAVADRADELDAVRLELTGDELARRIVAALGDAASLRSERRRPGRDVRRLAAGAGACAGAHVVPVGERLLQPHDHVEHHIAERRELHWRNRPMDTRRSGPGQALKRL